MLPLHNIRRQIRATLGVVLPRSPIRIITLLVLLCLGCLLVSIRKIEVPSASTRFNYILAHSPNWVAGKDNWLWRDHPHWGEAEDISALREAPWPGSFTIPNLRKKEKQEEEEVLTWNGNGFNRTIKEEEEPALLMLHIFSMPTSSSRRRRALIRQLHPINSVPLEYRYLVEIKFVLGHNEVHDDMSDEEKEKIEIEEREMIVEQREFGDLIRLEGLHGGENMNQGKTIEWMRWVGREGGRESQWVMKCDDDTLPILPNLLPILTELDASIPTYIGTALGHHGGYVYYFEGMMYGFNWGVIKTMAAAELGNDIIHRNFDEDAYTGLLMYNLPSKPDHPLAKSPQTNPHPNDPTNGTPYIPASPDSRTGLVRVDLGNRAGSFDKWWIAGPGRAVAWHYLKYDEAYRDAHDYAVEGFRRMGREFIWDPPRNCHHLAIGEIKQKKTNRWGLLR